MNTKPNRKIVGSSLRGCASVFVTIAYTGCVPDFVMFTNPAQGSNGGIIQGLCDPEGKDVDVSVNGEQISRTKCENGEFNTGLSVMDYTNANEAVVFRATVGKESHEITSVNGIAVEPDTFSAYGRRDEDGLYVAGGCDPEAGDVEVDVGGTTSSLDCNDDGTFGGFVDGVGAVTASQGGESVDVVPEIPSPEFDQVPPTAEIKVAEVPNLPNGALVFEVYFEDDIGPLAVEFDLDAFDTEFIDIEYDGEPLLSGGGSDAPYIITYAGSGFRSADPDLDLGAAVLTVFENVAVDGNNQGSAEVTSDPVEIDYPNAPGPITIASVPNLTVTSPVVSLEWDHNAPRNTSAYAVVITQSPDETDAFAKLIADPIEGSFVPTCTDCALPLSELSTGVVACEENYAWVFALDDFGNLTYATSDPFSVDTEAPIIEFRDISNNARKDRSPAFAFYMEDNCDVGGIPDRVGVTAGAAAGDDDLHPDAGTAGNDPAVWTIYRAGAGDLTERDTGAANDPTDDEWFAQIVDGQNGFDITLPNFGERQLTLFAWDSAGNLAQDSGPFRVQRRSVFQGTGTTGGQNLNQGSEKRIEWEDFSDFNAGYFDHDTGSEPEDVIIDDPNPTLLSLTVPLTTELDAILDERSGVQARVFVNGVAFQGWGKASSSHITGANNHGQSSLHLNTMLYSLLKNDAISISVESGTAATSQVLTELATLSLEPVVSDIVFYGTSGGADGNPNLNDSSYTALKWNPASSSDPSAEEVALGAGLYHVSYNIPLSTACTATDLNQVEATITLDGTQLSYTHAAQAHMTCLQGHVQSSLHWSGLVEVPAAADLEVVVRGAAAGTDTVDVPAVESATLLVREYDDDNDLIAWVQSSQGQMYNPAAEALLPWDTEALPLDDDAFKLVNSEQDLVAVYAGDYMLYYSDSVASANQRPNSRVDVLVNDTPIVGATCSTHYIRGNVSGHDTSSCSLTFPLELDKGDRVSVQVSQEAQTGIVTSVTPSNLVLIRDGS